VLPVLVGDRLIGRVDVRLDRDAGELVVRNAWWEPGVSERAVHRAMAALPGFAARLGADLRRPRPATSRG
jgi:uncharacterized protein YcaQ